MPDPAVPAASLAHVRPQAAPVHPTLPAAAHGPEARYQVRPVLWGHRSRFEVRDTATDATIAIRTTRRIADEDILVLNLAVPAARTLRAAPAPATEAAQPDHEGPRQCARCRQVFAVDPVLDPTALEDWWLCAPCRDALIGTPRKAAGGEGRVDRTQPAVQRRTLDAAG